MAQDGNATTASFQSDTGEQSRETSEQHPPAGTTADGSSLLSFFIPNLTVGGAEQVTVNIANGLAARGYDIELLLSEFEGELQSELTDRVAVVELPPFETSMFGVAANLPALAAYLRRQEPAVLFSHLRHPSIICLGVNKVLDLDTVVVPTHHSAYGTTVEQTPKDRIVQRLVPHLYPAADRIIAVSEGVADSLVEGTPISEGDLSVLHNPVDVETVRERAREPVDHPWIEDDDVEVVLFVGRIAQQKDLETWLRSFKRVHERSPDTRAVIAGQGPRREHLLSVADRHGLSDVVSIPGYVENSYRFMGQADVFLLSSRYEGLPTVLIEALACGCPIVATDCPSGPREILDGGKYGHLAPVGNADALAKAVIETLGDPIAADVLRRRADDFTPESVVDDYEQFIQDHVFLA